MNLSTQEEDRLSARSYGLQKIRGEGGAATGPWLRLHAGLVAAAVAVLFILGTGAAQFAQAQVESVLHSFTGTDGAEPNAGLVMDSSGNLYATTSEGGSSTNCGSWGCGTVFEMVYDSATNSYTEKVLYNFTGTDGDDPCADLIMDSKGNLYGTTEYGGSTYSSSSSPGYGTVFEMVYDSSTNSYTEKVLYSFTDGNDGGGPEAGLIMDSSGNLYGTALGGGSMGDGTVFEMVYASSTNSYTEKVLYTFTGTDGANPQSSLTMDSNTGNLYGTTEAGGSSGYGTVFELAYDSSTNSYTEKVLYSFTGNDGYQPEAGLIRDSNTGNLYGTTMYGGTLSVGNVFELVYDSSTSSYTEKVLYTFTGGADGECPAAGLIMDSAGNLYGTTEWGGYLGNGTVFELSPPATSGGSWTEKVLHAFAGTDGEIPYADLTMDSSGNLYSTTVWGGSVGYGTVFGIAPVTLSATSLSFGNVKEGTTSAAQTVTITNIGSGNFSYKAASFSGTGAADFAVTNGCSTAVAPNGTCSVSVTFMPSTGTAESASLDLSQGGMTQTINLTGAGVYPTAKLSSSSLTFSSEPVGSTSSSQTVTVTNNSTVTLNITSVGITGDFAIASNTCNTVAAGKTCTVGVTFTPTASGTQTGTLSFTDDAASGLQNVSLTGTGTTPVVTLSPSSLTFSSTVVGNTASAQSVTLTNNGTTSLTISGITASGEFAVASAGTTCSTSTALAASGSCTIAVTFTPDGAGTNTGTVTINDNAASSPQIIALSGEGAGFTLGMASGSSSSASVSAGGSASYTLALAPEGGFNQAVNLACSGAPSYATCTVSPASVTLNGTSNSSVSVKVSTTAASMVAPGPGNFGPPPSGSLPVVAWLALLGLLGLMALAKFSPKGGRVRRAAPWATLALVAALCAGCGGGSSGMSSTTSSNSTPAGTYTLTVTAKSGSLTHTSQVTLTVQ